MYLFSKYCNKQVFMRNSVELWIKFCFYKLIFLNYFNELCMFLFCES